MNPSGDSPQQPPPHPPGGGAEGDDRSFTEDDRLRLGAQQAAMMDLQFQAVQEVEMQNRAQYQQRLLAEEENQKRLAFATAMAEQQEQQHKMAEQQHLQELQMRAAAESQEEELKKLQMMALAEKEQEHMQQQHQRVMGPPPSLAGGMTTSLLGPPPSVLPPVSVSLASGGGIGGVSQQAPPPLSRPSLMSSSAPIPLSTGPPMSVAEGSIVSTSGISFAPVSTMEQQAPPIQARSLLGAPPTQQAPPDFESKPRPLMSIRTEPPQRQSDDDDAEKKDVGFKLPQALEKVLEFKNVRAQQLGVKPDEVEEPYAGDDEDEPVEPPTGDWDEDDDDEDEEEAPKPVQQKESKNKKKKKKKKKAKQRRAQQKPLPPPKEEVDDEEKVDIVYVSEELDIPITDPFYREFSKIAERFKVIDQEKEKARLDLERKREEEREKAERPSMKVKNVLSDEEQEDDDDDAKSDNDQPKLSKKKQKKLNRLSVAELKQLVTRPDVVEMHDVTARDPKLLVTLKATRNTVPVPRHWCFKRKYLQGKRGIEKTPFQLPAFIRDTGIEDMRAAHQEKEDAKNLKSKMRERVRPKMGKIDIDYQKLHDAFFRYQTKPKMTIHGDLYYEGKEFETRLKEKKPGNLTDDLRTALGMPLGPNCVNYPPPWLIAMQRYGPPPSYPNLKIPGLNAPIPEGCSFGYHAGGWGKPPVDESGKPLYGDVFGVQTTEEVQVIEDEDIDKTHWGQLESDSEEEEEDEDEDEDEDMEEPDATGLVTPADTGLVTPSGVTSVPVGMETPELIELRKKRIEDSMDQGGDTPALYTVLPEKKTNVGQTALMGSSHAYDLSGAIAAGAAGPAGGRRTGAGGAGAEADGIELALNPDELDLDQAAIQAKYDQQMREQNSQIAKEDLSDMVAEHAAKQKKRKKAQDAQGAKSAKKYKDFKF